MVWTTEEESGSVGNAWGVEDEATGKGQGRPS